MIRPLVGSACMSSGFRLGERRYTSPARRGGACPARLNDECRNGIRILVRTFKTGLSCLHLPRESMHPLRILLWLQRLSVSVRRFSRLLGPADEHLADTFPQAATV